MTPLWHGVALCRGFALDIGFRVSPWISFAYLGVWIAAGTAVGIRLMKRRLVL